MNMATRESNIFHALMARVSTQPTGLPVVYPGLVYPQNGAEKADQYIVVTHSPNRPERVWITAGEASHRHQGVLSLSLMTEVGVGNAEAVELSGELAAHFPADLKLMYDNIILRIVQDAHISTGYRDGDRWRTPIVVEYQSIRA